MSFSPCFFSFLAFNLRLLSPTTDLAVREYSITFPPFYFLDFSALRLTKTNLLRTGSASTPHFFVLTSSLSRAGNRGRAVSSFFLLFFASCASYSLFIHQPPTPRPNTSNESFLTSKFGVDPRPSIYFSLGCASALLPSQDRRS